MPPAPPYAAQQPYPALYLYPLNDSFVPKHISLVAGQRVKIGRQTNPKTAPGEKNGFFDSKVLSRQHAEIWEDGGKIYIKDVKSSNGTFINGERLSPEGVESDPYELKSDDIVEFGIDIVGEDNKTIIHHKVAARSVCVFSEQDAQVAARAEQHQQQQQQQQHLLQQQQQHQQQQYAQHSLMGAGQPGGGPNGISSQFNFGNGGPQQQQRRPGPNVPGGQGLAGIGGMGGSMRPPGKSGLTFEHILNRLQGELQKSRETGSELHSLSGSMNDIHQVLGGNIPANIPPYPHSLPPARPLRQSSPSQAQEPQHPAPSSTSPPPSDQQPPPPSSTTATSPPEQQQQEQPTTEVHSPPASVISQLQTQLYDTQTSLAEHANKVRALEEVLADQEFIRKEVRDLRQLMDSRQQDLAMEPLDEEEDERNARHRHHHHHHQHHQLDDDGLLEPRGGFDPDDDDDIQHIRRLDEVDGVDDSDVRSISTIVPHELEPVDEEDEEDVAAAERDIDNEYDTEREHEGRLGRVDEVDFGEEDGTTEDDDDDSRADPIDPEREREDESDRQRDRDLEREQQFEQEAALRKREDLDVGRPRTPEPSFGLRDNSSSNKDATTTTSTKPNVSIATNAASSPRTRSGTLLGPAGTSRSPSSPLAHPSVTAAGTMGSDEVMEQVLQLSAQISAMAKLTSSIEAQYSAAQDTIRALEGKVSELERTVKDSKEKPEVTALADAVVVATAVPTVADVSTDIAADNDGEEDKKSLTEFFAEWKKTVEGQWSDVKEEWREERERLKRAREEWETKMKSMDSGLEKINQIHTSTTALVKDIGSQKQELSRIQERVQSQFQQALGGLRIGNGDAAGMKYGSGSGLVTPPSPTSQSSGSSGGGSRTRRKRKNRGRSGRRSGSASGEEAGAESGSEGEAGSSLDAVKVTAFANGSLLLSGSGGSSSSLPNLEQSPSSSSDTATSGSPKTATSSTTAVGDDGTAASRAYSISLLDVQKEQVFDYEDDAGSSLASEEDDVEEGKKVPGPKDPALKAKARAAAVSKELTTPTLVSPLTLSGQDNDSPAVTEVEQKKVSPSRTNAVNFQTAGAVVVLAVAAAAVFWKVRSE